MNAKILLMLAVFGMVAAIQGCSLKPQNLRLDPVVKLQGSQIGAGKTVGLEVLDVRSNKKLGEVGDPDHKMVDVTINEDAGAMIYPRVAEALSKLGFKVVPFTDDAERSLKVEVRKLELQSEKKPVTFDTELRAEMGARARNGIDFYDRQFNVRTRKDGAAPPFEKDSTALVNTAVSQALEDMFTDEQLIGLLAQ